MKVAPLLSLVLLPGCGWSLRGGPKTSVSRGDGALQGEVTMAGGFAGEKAALGVPLTFAAGSRFDGTAVTHFESGMEYSLTFGEGPFGMADVRCDARDRMGHVQARTWGRGGRRSFLRISRTTARRVLPRGSMREPPGDFPA